MYLKRTLRNCSLKNVLVKKLW